MIKIDKILYLPDHLLLVAAMSPNYSIFVLPYLILEN
jgi:hypothetical protein